MEEKWKPGKVSKGTLHGTGPQIQNLVRGCGETVDFKGVESYIIANYGSYFDNSSNPCDEPCDHEECQRFVECDAKQCTKQTAEPIECNACKRLFCSECSGSELSWCRTCVADLCSQCNCGHETWGCS